MSNQHYVLSQWFNAEHASLHQQLKTIRRGIEKESLRICPNGKVSQKPHPKALGSTLTHSQITTDYSEALMEFITGVHDSIDGCLQELEDIHRFTYQHLGDELLWTASMPCFIAEEKDVPIAQYGSSNVGQMKHIYRIGLEHRYGRIMQAIAGLHYNFSLSNEFWKSYQSLLNNTDDFTHFKNTQYLHLIRNFHRNAWLLVYLFSASPAVCETFVNGREHNLQRLANGDLGNPQGMCLRMSDLGYQSSAQDDLIATYNCLESYIETVLPAIKEKHADYEKIGLQDSQGKYQQLSTHLLQIENEFYSIIRPKTVAKSGEAPLIALQDRGIEYIEVRCLDLNPSLPLGVNAEQIRFVDAFLLHCLFSDSPRMDIQSMQTAKADFKTVVNHGLNPQAQLSMGELQNSARDLLSNIKTVCEVLDQVHNSNDYSASWQAQMNKVEDNTLSPAGNIMQTLIPETNGETQHFHHWAMQQSKNIKAYFTEQALSTEQQNAFTNKAIESLNKQANIEASDNINFETFLRNFYQQYETL